MKEVGEHLLISVASRTWVAGILVKLLDGRN